MKKFSITFNTPLADNHFTFVYAKTKEEAEHALRWKYEGIRVEIVSIEEEI